MAATPIRSACENCGSSAWTHVTGRADHKQALMRVRISPVREQTADHDALAGTPVDVYACDACGLLRLFALERRAR